MTADQPRNLPRVEVARAFPVSLELVFRAFSSAEHLKHWFCPAGFTVAEARVEFRVGGLLELCMCSAQGERRWMRGRFTEIFPHDRLAFDADVYGSDAHPLFRAHTLVRVRAEAHGTRVEVTQSFSNVQPAAFAMLDGARQGWQETLERLATMLEQLQREPRARRVVHGSFTIERLYPVTPAQVFHALSDPTAKAQWFGGGPGFTALERHMEVRPGGRERLRARWANGVVTTFDAQYFDVIPEARLMYAYEMHLNERKISVSLASLELEARGADTRLRLTEQGAFLDDFEDAGSREQGTQGLLDALGRALDKTRASGGAQRAAPAGASIS